MWIDKPKRIALLGARISAGNLGVGALASGAIRCIHKRWPEAEIYILDYDRRPSQEVLRVDGDSLPIKLVNIRFSKKIYKSNNIAALLVLAVLSKLVPSHRLRSQILSRNAVLQKLNTTDLVLSIAGGDSFSDIYGLRRFLYVSLPQVLTLLLRRSFIILPQHIGPFRSRASRLLARFIVRNAQHAYGRDCQSVIQLTEMVRPERPTPVPALRYDLGFALMPEAPQKIAVAGGSLDLTRPDLTGINVSGLLYMGGYNRKNMFGLRADYRGLTIRLIKLLIETKNVPVLLIPHVFGGRADSESDVVACNEIYSLLSSKYGNMIDTLRGEYKPGEIKHIIGLCDFFVGARMHACIAALSQSVPTVPVAYSDKFVGVMETFGCGSIVADARKHDTEKLLLHLENSYDSRATLRTGLLRKMPGVIDSTLGLFSRPTELRMQPAAYASGQQELAKR